MIYKILLFGVLTYCFQMFFCLSFKKDNNFKNMSNQVIKTIPTVDTKSFPVWNCEIKLTDTQSNFKFIKFFNNQLGVALSSQSTLFTTQNGGENWRKVRLNGFENLRITSMDFLSPQNGFVVLVNFSKDVLSEKENESIILKTTDGGNSWNKVSNLSSIIINDIKFFDNKEGWAVGRKRVRSEVLKDQIFVIYTNDSGNNWNPISSEFSETLNDFGEKIVPTKSGEAELLSIDQKIFRVNFSENTLYLTDKFDENPQTYLGKLGFFPNGEKWIVGGADSNEGIWGNLFIGKNNNWTRLNFDFYLNNFVPISNDELIISGHRNVKDGLNESVMKYSTDKGVSWANICNDKNIPEVESFSLLDKNHLWGVGGDSIIFLKRIS